MIRFENVSRIYRTRRGEVKALDNVTLHVEANEFLVVRGPSGSGKTTLLLAAGAMHRPTSGRVLVKGDDLYAMSPRERAAFRARHIGFVFQMFHLIPYLTVLENVMLGGGAVASRARREEATQMLERLDIQNRESHKPAELSAGERQRTAIARAMLGRPKLILADEPTGNLDPENARQVIERLSEFHRDGVTVVVVTHGAVADQHASRIIHLAQGRIAQEAKRG
ncbi:MAG TPA: ABC transporter ATP-binding protein [Sumerlaeia bacterium]|nr:ABC transporter ATP-binding protein [Sumerlaeia bacterium]